MVQGQGEPKTEGTGEILCEPHLGMGGCVCVWCVARSCVHVRVPVHVCGVCSCMRRVCACVTVKRNILRLCALQMKHVHINGQLFLYASLTTTKACCTVRLFYNYNAQRSSVGTT